MRYNFKFLQTGGVPLTNDLMSLIEEAYGIFEVLGDLSGNLTILSGCDITGTNVMPGIVAIEGKLYYFEGGSIISTVYIHKEDIQKTFEDQTTKTLIEKRTVRFGSGTVNYNWSDFVKLKTLKEIQAKVDNSVSQDDFDALVDRVEVLEIKTAPIINGGIVMVWRKPFNEIPAGWKECIDFQGKTIIGIDPNDSTFNTLGVAGGAKTKTILQNNLPSLSASANVVQPYTGQPSGGGFDGGGNLWGNRNITFNLGGTSAPFDVMNPYRIVLFIEPNFQ